MRGIQVGRQVILRGAADADHPKLHLQPIANAEHQGVHSRDLRKQELWKIAKQELWIIAKGKCELYLRNLVHFTAKLPRESTAKNAAFRTFRRVRSPCDWMIPYVLHRPCSFSSCAKVFNFSGKHCRHHPIYCKFISGGDHPCLCITCVIIHCDYCENVMIAKMLNYCERGMFVRHWQKGKQVLSVIRRRALVTIIDCGISMYLSY